MNRIRMLSEQVANQIAAGEVVERPASVVKELVENSLDAKASRVTVEIQAGGRSLIRVTDDGVGMSRDDALLSLERHATSKIQAATDLTTISTMGFRGEAIPSIASVSRMTLTTREHGTEAEGTQVVINGGRIVEVKAAGLAPGTAVEVRQLFFNLPARRKFLRSEETERAHIQHYLTLVALAYPEVAFTFIQEGRVFWQLPAVGSKVEAGGGLRAVRERLHALYSSDLKLLEVERSFEMPTFQGQEEFESKGRETFRIWGLIGAPGVSRSTREDQHVFVNKRPVENRGINFALLEGYHTSLMKGRYPFCCLFLELDPAGVDVNIHPAKREVKFHQEQAVRRFVAQAMRETLLEFHGRPSGDVPETAPAPPGAGIAAPAPAPPAWTPPPRPQIAPALNPPAPSGPVPDWPNRAEPIPRAPSPEPSRSEPTLPGFAAVAAPLPVASVAPGPVGPVPLLKVPLRLVGVVGRLYVVLESDRGLVLLDQHAAHERILFERMLDRLQAGNAPSQRLLLPETVELSPRDAQFVRDQLETLTRLGVGLSEFGERTFLLDALPPFIKVSDAKRFMFELIDGLKEAGQEVNSWRLGEHTVAKTVCRHAVKANDPLSAPELENLVNDLRLCSMPYTCPHGRPTIIEMNFRELEKKFGRTQ